MTNKDDFQDVIEKVYINSQFIDITSQLKDSFDGQIWFDLTAKESDIYLKTLLEQISKEEELLDDLLSSPLAGRIYRRIQENQRFLDTTEDVMDISDEIRMVLDIVDKLKWVVQKDDAVRLYKKITNGDIKNISISSSGDLKTR